MIEINQRYPAYKAKNELRNRQRREMEKYLLPPSQQTFKYRLYPSKLYYDFETWNLYILKVEHPDGRLETLGPLRFNSFGIDLLYFEGLTVATYNNPDGIHIVEVIREIDYRDIR